MPSGNLDGISMRDGHDDSPPADVAPMSDAEYERLALVCEDMELDAIWHELGFERRGIDWVERFRSFGTRKRAFLWVVRRLVLDGRIALVPNGRHDLTMSGSLDEHIEVMNRAFPQTDDEMNNGIWFFMSDCPFGGNWRFLRTPPQELP